MSTVRFFRLDGRYRITRFNPTVRWAAHIPWGNWDKSGEFRQCVTRYLGEEHFYWRPDSGRIAAPARWGHSYQSTRGSYWYFTSQADWETVMLLHALTANHD